MQKERQNAQETERMIGITISIEKVSFKVTLPLLAGQL
jgi:hypothetical protein